MIGQVITRDLPAPRQHQPPRGLPGGVHPGPNPRPEGVNDSAQGHPEIHGVPSGGTHQQLKDSCSQGELHNLYGTMATPSSGREIQGSTFSNWLELASIMCVKLKSSVALLPLGCRLVTTSSGTAYTRDMTPSIAPPTWPSSRPGMPLRPRSPRPGSRQGSGETRGLPRGGQRPGRCPSSWAGPGWGQAENHVGAKLIYVIMHYLISIAMHYLISVIMHYLISIIRGGSSVRKRGGGKIEKLGNHFATLQNQLMCILTQREFKRLRDFLFGEFVVR